LSASIPTQSKSDPSASLRAMCDAVSFELPFLGSEVRYLAPDGIQ